MAANPGALRFNTDSLKMELFDGNQWVELVATSADSQTGGARGIYDGGSTTPTIGEVIDYITISTTGNAQDFGNLTYARQAGSHSCASNTRACFGGGYGGTGYSGANTIDFVTISSTGNAQDFGDLTVPTTAAAAASNSTRGIYYSGSVSPSPPYTHNVISYITIASQGVNAQDVGDAITSSGEYRGCASSTRGLFGTGNPVGVDFVTISTLGNASDFGSVTGVNNHFGSGSNSTRAVFAGGYITNAMAFVTIASLGNAQDFGDLTVARRYGGGAASPTRIAFGGGATPSSTNVIDYVTIQTTGNATDFGDLTVARGLLGACSNGHGGL